MTKYPFIDDMPEADEKFIRNHRDELLALAAELGITNVRVSSTGRMVGCTGPASAPLAPYEFTAQAGMRLERIVPMYSDEVTKRPGASEDLRSALPL